MVSRAKAPELSKKEQEDWKSQAQDATTGEEPTPEQKARLEKAKNIAEERNKNTLKKAIKKADALTLNTFIVRNIDKFPPKHRKQINEIVSDIADRLDEADKNQDTNKRKEITKELLSTVTELIDEKPFEELDIKQFINKKQFKKDYTTTPKVYDELLKDENFKKERNKHLEQVATKLTVGAKQLLTGNLGQGALNTTIVPLYHLWLAREKHNRNTTIHTILKTGACAAAITTALAAPIIPGDWAKETFMKDALTADNMIDAYKFDPIVAERGKLVAAWAASFYTRTDDPNLDIAFTSYLAALKQDSKVIPPMLISLKETGFLTDAVSNNSSAINLYQMVLKTKLDWLKNHHDELDFAGDTLGKKVIDHLVKDYKKDKKDLINKIRNKKITPAHLLALQTADRPEIAGQLYALEAHRLMPEMNINFGDRDNLNDQKLLAGIAYAPHILGPHGADFLHYVIKTAPETKMNDILELNAIYSNYPGKIEGFNAGEYYMKMARKNQSVMKSSNVTALEYLESIGNVVTESKKVKNLLEDIENRLEKNDTVWEILVKDPKILEEAVPESTTLAEIAYKNTLSKEWRQKINMTAQTTMTALNINNIWDDTAKPAPEIKIKASEPGEQPPESEITITPQDIKRRIETAQTLKEIMNKAITPEIQATIKNLESFNFPDELTTLPQSKNDHIALDQS